ncbi:helix-turn-helix transcriptional regulator [Pedobacter nototheniae]|uniref:helix-turn-helix domain-containing protein n=1 Tax=Pedobacter nototheniae TaxID=2488994 RepID=UPI002930922A|nr:helix-turn-helix transcriptional regulator [Pedobacter nototheniae]
MKTKANIPVLGISEFRIDQEAATDNSFQYHEIIGSRYIESPHIHDFFLFLLFEKGSGTHTIDFIEYNVEPKQLHLLFPGQVHSWKLGETTNAVQIMVSRRIFETFANALRYDFVLYRKHPVLNLTDETFQRLLYEFQSVRYELNLKPVLLDIISSRCKIIAQMASREAEESFEDLKVYHTKPILIDYLSLIDVHFKAHRSVKFYAEKLNITANYLNILSQKHFHTSATSLIHNRITLEAKRLLLTSKNSVKEIAYALSFYDLAYFSKFFKNQTGIGPREFRTPL